MNDFLPVSREDMLSRGWDCVDFLLVSGDAYVDHPSFGAAVIGRVLEREGYRVGVLPQPVWKNADAFRKLGRPRLGFLVTAGNMDSMVNRYTAAKRLRSKDAYSPGGRTGLRPDRAAIVYANKCREAFPGMPVIIGGIEASLRRFAHYDYWDDAVRASVLIDSGADLLVYGMGERAVVEIAQALDNGIAAEQITFIRGTCYKAKDSSAVHEPLFIESLEAVCESKKAYARAFRAQYLQQDAVYGRTLVQQHGDVFVVQNPPAYPLETHELDAVYELPFTRRIHPMYEKEGVPAIEEVAFSITSCRGCFGGCSFCALTFHQGRVVQGRSRDSVIREAGAITKLPGFKGNIHDVGGPTANFSGPACEKQEKEGACLHRRCLTPKPCPNLKTGHRAYLDMLRGVAGVSGVKRVFVRSGLRYDYMMLDKDSAFFDYLVRHNVSGQLKVAPEHVSRRVLRLMGKPERAVYDAFAKKFLERSRKAGKEQYLVPYFMSSHPGCSLKEAVELAEYLRDIKYCPEQVQDFYPTPGTLSTCMYYTGYNPLTMERVYVPRDPEEKAMQRALMQYNRPANRPLVEKALRKAKREDLIGYGPLCLIRPQPPKRQDKGPARKNAAKGYGGNKTVSRKQHKTQAKNRLRVRKNGV
ncbi:MAG: YgiQ family radical SAM protein [Bacillota bacterium]